jgi:glutathione S-transferase
MPSSDKDAKDDVAADKKDAILVHDMRPMTMRHLRRPPLSVVMGVYDMFNKIGRREPPDRHKTKHLRLITIRVSHYNEKARWALDLLEEDETSTVYYTEDTHPSGFQAFESVRASKGHASATPMVVEDDEVWSKSDAILRHFCPQLYPASHKVEIEQLEDDWGDRLGPAVRTYAYGVMLEKEQWPSLVQMNTGPECSRIENILFPYMRNMVGPALRKSLRVNTDSVVLAQETIRDVFQKASHRLQQQNSGYLVGESFTAADLIFAALSSPLIRPPQLEIFQAPLDGLPTNIQSFIQEMQATPAGQHALKMYRNHRYPNAVGRAVRIKCAGRNRIPWMAVAGVAALTAVVVKAVA